MYHSYGYSDICREGGYVVLLCTFAPCGPIGNESALVQVMAKRGLLR